METNFGRLMTEKEAAGYMGLARVTLETWRRKGKPHPRYCRIGVKAIRYRKPDLDEFIRASVVETADVA